MSTPSETLKTAQWDGINMDDLPIGERLRVRRWIAACEYIDTKTKGRMEAYSEASTSLTQILGTRISPRSVERKYLGWKNEGKSWVYFADMRLASTKCTRSRPTPPDF